MCWPNRNPNEEILKLPTLIREKGWDCSDVRENGTFIQGASDPPEHIAPDVIGAAAIRVYSGVAFNITAREEDLKVRIAWPGQFTTSFSCDSADQVIMWLGRMIAIAEEDYKRLRKSREP